MAKFKQKIAIRLLGAVGRLFGLRPVFFQPLSPVHPKWHQDFIVHLAQITRPKSYLELGIYQCGLFNKMSEFVENATGVDQSQEAESYMEKRLGVRFFCMSTVEYIEILKKEDTRFDYIFIDADHSKSAVEFDFAAYFEYLKPHGLMLIHDTHPLDESATASGRCGDGHHAIEAYSRNCDRWEMVTIPVHPGLTICRKRNSQLKWKEPRPIN